MSTNPTALELSEERLRLALEVTKAGLWDWHIQTGYTYCNPDYYRMLGYDPSEFCPEMKSHFLELLHPEDRDEVMVKIQQHIVSPGHYEVEFRMRDKAGIYHWITSRGQVVEHDAEGNPVRAIGTHVDITERKNAELALLESERRFREMADSAPVMIWMSGLDKRCFYFNKTWSDFRGRTVEEEAGNEFIKGLHPDDLDTSLKIYSNAFNARESFCMDYRLCRHDNEYRWIQDNGRPRFDSQGKFLGYISSCVDVTERKTAEQYFRIMVEASPNALLLVDERGKIIIVNEQLEKLFGYEPNELIGKLVEELVPTDRRHQHVDDREMYLKHPVPREIGKGRTVFGQKKDGSSFPAELGLNPMNIHDRPHVIAAVIDITEQKRAEQALQKSEERLGLALQGADLGLWDWDIPKGTVFFSDQWINMLGYSREEIDPHYEQWARLVHPDDMPGVMATLESHLAGRSQLYEVEHRLLTKEGTWKWVWSSGRVCERDAKGAPLRAAGTHLDISARKDLEMRLRQQQEELLFVQRLTTAGELAATMAHELNQPLGAIAGYLQGISLRFRGVLDENPKLDLALQEILRLSGRAASVVASIRNLARKNEGEWEWLSPHIPIKAALDLLRTELRQRKIKVDYCIAEPLPLVFGQRTLLQQLLINLIVNAMEAMGRVEAGHRCLIIRAGLNDKQEIEMCVCDTGQGIAPEVEGRLFEPFVSDKPSGIGLGLAICRTIVEAHGGRIVAHSVPQEMTIFQVTLPLAGSGSDQHVN